MPPMPRRCFLCLLLAAFAVGFAPAPLPRPQRKTNDLSSLQGRWRMTRQEVNGSPIPHDYEFVMKGSRWEYFRLGGDVKTPGPVYHIVLNRGVQPFLIEWKHNPQATTSWVGSYRVRGRTLEVLYTPGSDASRRPTDFEGRAPHRMVFEYLGPE